MQVSSRTSKWRRLSLHTAIANDAEDLERSIFKISLLLQGEENENVASIANTGLKTYYLHASCYIHDFAIAFLQDIILQRHWNTLHHPYHSEWL